MVKGLHAQFVFLWALDHFGYRVNGSHDRGRLGGNGASWHLLTSSFILSLFPLSLVRPHTIQNTLGGWLSVGDVV